MKLSKIYQILISATLSIIIVSLTTAVTLAGGDDVTVVNNTSSGDATERTQLSNHQVLRESAHHHQLLSANSATSLLNQAEMLARQLTTINDMVQNSKSVSNSVWSQTSNLLENLARVVTSGQALSYANQNIEDKFRNLYPGYRVNHNYSKDYRNWSDASMDSIRGSLHAANLHANDFANEDQLIAQLSNMSQTASGRMQAIQTGNMIAIEQVQQLRKLRQLQMTQMQAQNSYLASRKQEEITKKANQDNFFDVAKGNRAHKRFVGGSRR
jgi:P-type conjugative transfer protein TrbJ